MTDLWRCTVCGQVSTVGRCCGEETREPWRPIRRKDEEETRRIEAVADRAEQLEAEIDALRAKVDALTARLGDIYQIADAALSKENKA